MNFMQIIKTIVVLGLLTAFISCSGDGSSNSNKVTDSKDTTTEQSVDNNTSTETYYLIPSPKELFRFIHDGHLKFSESILNPVDNLNNYIGTRAKELNFGVYSADLAYVASFNKYQQSIDYLGVVRNLSDDIGMSSIFDENLVSRIDNITDNKDSLLRVTNDTYLSIVSYLEDVQREATLAQIVTGGWVESIYVVVNLLENYKSNSQIISLLAAQKGVVSNLVMYLKQRKNDSNIQATLADFQPIAKFYESLKVKKQDNVKDEKTDKKTDKIVVGGKQEIVMDEKQFEVLKTEITKLRNKIIKK